MNVEEEIQRLRGESIALQSVVIYTLTGLISLGEPFKTIVALAFDHADQVAEQGAFKLGGPQAQVHLQTFASVLEQLRDIVLGSRGEPKQGV